ncbi:MAG: hypothetical protein U0744_21380 [Gemmataceae bacterium]
MQRLAAIAAAWLVITTAAVFAQDNPAATPNPRKAKDGQPDAGWMKRHEGFVAIAKKGDVDLLFVGDSITDGWRNQKAWKHFGVQARQFRHAATAPNMSSGVYRTASSTTSSRRRWC